VIEKAVQQVNGGNFDVLTDKGLVAAVIVKSDLGWRVMSRTQRKNSRQYSATPEQAARKYYRRSLPFYYRLNDGTIVTVPESE
jgi:hypothetical protein